MKKIILVLLVLLVVLLLPFNSKEKEEQEIRGVFFSYIDIENHFKNKNGEEINNEVKNIIDNLNNNKINTIYLHVISFAKTLYKSSFYDEEEIIKETRIDLLKEFIDEASKCNIKVFAWINPYRISNDKEYDASYFNDKEVNKCITKLENGVYFNPSCKEFNNYFKNVIDEVLKYDIKGIIFDDYFYPSNNIDLLSKDSREKIIEDMLLMTHNECIKYGKLFAISPQGNIENNYELGLNIKKVVSDNTYIDYVMPQIYFGFFNETKPYLKTLEEWINISNIDVVTSLALYKENKEDNYAKQGKREWINSKNILMREIIVSRKYSKYKGFSLFRYDNLIDSEEFTNIKSLLD